MGKPIVYCGGCGKSLREEEFVKGRAQLIDNSPFCGVCRPVTSPPPPPSSKKLVTAPPSPVATLAPPRRTEAAPSPPRSLYISGVLVACLVVALIWGALRDPGSAPTPSEPNLALTTIQSLESFAATSTDPDAILRRCQEDRMKVWGTPHQSRLEAVEARARKDREVRNRLAALTTPPKPAPVPPTPPVVPAAAKRPGPPGNVLYSENFSQGIGKIKKGEVVDGALALPKTGAWIEGLLPQPVGPTWTLRFKAKPVRDIASMEVVIYSSKSRANHWYLVRGLKKDQWNLVEATAGQIHRGRLPGGPTFQGETAQIIKFYFEAQAPDGSILLDDIEVSE